MMQEKTVYCVIPVHNRLEITKRCLGYLSAQDYPALHIVIVDDGSTDGTGEYLAQSDLPNLTVLTGGGNLWWGGAMHMGIDHIVKIAGKDDYLLMLNDDVRVEKNYVSSLVEESIAHNGSVVGSTQRDEVTGQILGSGYLIDYWRMRFLSIETLAQWESVDAVPGRGVLFPISAVLRAGNINVKAFRHYFGDLEYSARVRDLGWGIFISNKADIYSASDSSDEKVRSQGWAKEYFSFRSKNDLKQRLWFFTVRGPYWLRIWAIPRYLLVVLYRMIRSEDQKVVC